MSVNKRKHLGQVFTPPEIVKTILDEVGYHKETILSKTILEPSFGDGVFLYEIINRIHKEGIKQNLSSQEIATIIDANVWGIEYDPDTYNAALSELKNWYTTKYNTKITLPNLILGDSLQLELENKFDFVVGNPPYIRIHNIPQNLRNILKNYEHTTGNTDLYVIFFELGLKWLNSEGKLGFITPNSWFRNSSQKNLRKNLIEQQQIIKIINYGSTKIFPNVGTYTAITILGKNQGCGYEFINHSPEFSTQILFSEIKPFNGAPWVFTSDEDKKFLDNLKGVKLETLFNVQNGLATLGDKYFILDKKIASDLKLEPKYLRTAVKASTFKGKDQNTVIIFPYSKVEEKWQGIPEETLKAEAPNIHKYLLQNKKTLSARSLDKNSLWFWYGRSQAIQSVEDEKIVIAPLLKDTDEKGVFYKVPKDTLIYSGLFISQPKTRLSLESLLPQLITIDFAKYLKLNGKDMSGGYKSFNSRTVKDYLLPAPSDSAVSD